MFFSLLVMLQCHLMGLATDAGFLITAKGSMGGMRVVAVHLYATCLNTTAHAVGANELNVTHFSQVLREW